MKILPVTLISVMVLLASGLTYAQDSDPEPRKPHHHKHHGKQMPMETRVFRSFRRLDLDESQKTELKNIMRGMREELKPVMQETRAGQKQIRGQLHAGTFDEAAMAALAQRQGELTTEHLMITSRAISAAFDLLNDEQRARFKANTENRRAERMEKRQKKQAES